MKLSDRLIEVSDFLAGIELEVDGQSAAVDLSFANAELHRLTAALPKTADGVTIVPGMRLARVKDGIMEDGVWVKSIHHDGSMVVEGDEEMTDTYFDTDDGSGFDFYSTRTAAEEAADNGR